MTTLVNKTQNVNSKISKEMEETEVVKDIKTVAFKATLSGEGIVNFDHADMQKYFMEKHQMKYFNNGRFNNNHKLAKKSFYREEVDGKEVVKAHLKISTQCMRRNIFGNRNFTQLDWQKKESVLARIVTPQEYTRGYMAADSKNWSFNKTSGVYISPAIDKKAIVVPEWGVNGNEIKPKENENEKCTGIYISDVTGKTEYEIHGYYRPKLDQFLCLDRNGRMALPEKLCETNEMNTPLAQAFMQKYDRKPYTYGNYVLNNGQPSRYQLGCMFDNEYVNFLFKTFINDLKNFEIGDRTTGYCMIVNLELAFINKGGTPESEYKWKNINEIDLNQTFDFHQFFRPAETHEIEMIDKGGIIEEAPSKTSSKSKSKKTSSTK